MTSAAVRSTPVVTWAWSERDPGIGRPDLGIIDDEFARRFSTNPHPNLQIGLWAAHKR